MSLIVDAAFFVPEEAAIAARMFVLRSSQSDVAAIEAVTVAAFLNAAHNLVQRAKCRSSDGAILKPPSPMPIGPFKRRSP